MKHVFDAILRLDRELHFCEDAAASIPVDQVQSPMQGRLADKVIGLKSNIRVVGQAWTAGIGARLGHIAEADAQIAARLRSEGALILSRLAMDEGALGAATDNPHFGRCENPTYRGHSAGGSSGGSAASVACGAVDAAIGSDTMGSVRIPAAYCGVYGLKVGADVLTMEGVFPLAPSLDALGVFAKTPAILRSVFEVLCEPSHMATHQIDGWIAPDKSLIMSCHPDVASFYHDAHAALTRLLGSSGQMPPLDLSQLRQDAFVLTEVEAVDSLGAEDGLSPGLAGLIDYGRRMPANKLSEAKRHLDFASTSLRAALGTSRVLLLPTVAEPAFEHGARPPLGQADFTVLANIAGLPALSIPKPRAVPPVAVQLVGPRGSERALIDLADSFVSLL